MSHKQDKKLRKMYRNRVEVLAVPQAEKISNAMKPKPRFIPWWVWMLGLRIFIKTKK